MADDDWFSDPDSDDTSNGGEPTATPGVALSVVHNHDPDPAPSSAPDWFDDIPQPAFAGKPEQPVTAPAPAQPGRGRRTPRRPRLGQGGHAVVYAVIGLLALGTAAAVVISTVLPDNDTGSMTLPPTSAAPSASSAAESGDAWCARLAGGEVISEASADHGKAAIAGFENGYYVARNANTARANVAPDARVGSVQDLTAGINTVPAGTTHCVLAQQVAPGIYAVDIFARRPDGVLDHHPQTITTIDAPQAPHGALITSVETREEK